MMRGFFLHFCFILLVRVIIGLLILISFICYNEKEENGEKGGINVREQRFRTLINALRQVFFLLDFGNLLHEMGTLTFISHFLTGSLYRQMWEKKSHAVLE